MPVQQLPYIWMFLLTGLLAWMGFFAGQADFFLLFPAYSAYFVGYIWLSGDNFARVPYRLLLFWAIGLRLMLWFAFPGLSDDVFRFIWDGRLLAAGHNPFDATPELLMQQPPPGFAPDPALFAELNSPAYFTVYPPLSQAIFAGAALVFSDQLYWSAWLMKLPLVAADIGNIFLMRSLLQRLGRPVSLVWWYALNPLILLEISGNLHFEGLMLFFFLLGWLALISSRPGWAALALSLSVGTKLLTLLYVPALLRRLTARARWWFPVLLTVFIAVLFVPFLNASFGTNLGQSLDLYFRKFEFNASFYYLLRELGFAWSGYNRIALMGPALSAVFVGLLLIHTFTEKQPRLENWATAVLLIHTLYLWSSTTVHPWYLTFVLACVPFTGFRYPVFWSYLIYLSYATYMDAPYRENPIALVLEYGSVIPLALYEWRRRMLN